MLGGQAAAFGALGLFWGTLPSISGGRLGSRLPQNKGFHNPRKHPIRMKALMVPGSEDFTTVVSPEPQLPCPRRRSAVLLLALRLHHVIP
jgi:hypothetical protein